MSNTLVVVGAQWGDEGKGKITDFYAGDADVVVRHQGGNNAGILCCWYNPKGQKNLKNIRIDYEIDDLNKILERIQI